MTTLIMKCRAAKKGNKPTRNKKEKLMRTSEMQGVTKALIAINTLAAYPNHNKPYYDIYNNTPDYYLGADNAEFIFLFSLILMFDALLES